MSDHRKESSFEWVKYKPGNVWDNWKEYYSYRFAESIVDALDEAAAEKKQKRANENSNKSSDEGQKNEWIIAIVVWVFAFILIALNSALKAQ